MEQKEIRKNSQRNAVKHILVEYGTRGEAIYLNNKHSLKHSCLNSKHKGTIRTLISYMEQNRTLNILWSIQPQTLNKDEL